MRTTTTAILAAVCLCAALVESLPIATQGLKSQDATPEASETNQVQVVEADSQPASQNNDVQVQFADEVAPSGNEAAATGDGELAPLDDIEASDDDNRNKRFLNFGFGASGGNGGAGGGSGGGSGNFLFDIIRLVAGSGSSSSGGGSSSSDPAAGAPTPGPQTEAVPGPVTRLFVIANRGISNLIQDLILRLAATSERIVNFKARLITSII